MVGKTEEKDSRRPPRQILARTNISSRRSSLRSSINHLLTTTNNEGDNQDDSNFWNVSQRWFADATEQIVGNVSGAAVDDTAFRTSGIEIVSATDFDEEDYNDDDDDDYDNHYETTHHRKYNDDVSSIGDTITAAADIRTAYSRHHMMKFICKWVLLVCMLLWLLVFSTAQYNTQNTSIIPRWMFLRKGRSKWFQPMKEIFIELSGEEAFFDVNSPQYRALLFLAEHDPLKLNPHDPQLSTQIIQRYALSVFYFATGGPSWKHRVYWLTGQHECGWQYVICNDVQEENNTTIAAKSKRQKISIQSDQFNPENTDDDFSDFADSNLGLGKGRIVTGLKLFDNGLVSSFLPTELFLLKYLHVLDLGKNTLGGTIDQQFSQLTHLRELYLNWNDFEGKLDVNMTNGLTKLKVLSLGHNSLTGKLEDSFLQDLTSLENLSLEFNKLTGMLPSALGKIKTLQHIRIGGNALHGKIPPSLLKNLPNLQRLWLQENRLTGSIPSNVFCDVSSSMVDLRLQNNSFVGEIPNLECTMEKLELLSMASNELEGPLPTNFGDHFPSLKELHLYDNQLTSTIPSSIFNPVNISAVLLGMNELTGTLSDSMIQEGNNLVHLYLNANKLGGTLEQFAQTKGLRSLKKLRLEYNKFSGAIPRLDLFPDLELFFAYNNSLLTSGLDNLSSSVALKKLKLSNCSITGEIPTTLGSLTSLEVLDLDGNRLTGTVPSEMQQLTALEELRLEVNDLSGVVPPEVCDLRSSQLTTFISDCKGEWSGVGCSCCTECF